MGKAANERKRQKKQERQKWKIQEPIDTVEQAVDFAAMDSSEIEP